MECELINIHEDAVQEVRQAMPNPDQIHQMATLLKAFSDPTRLKILEALRQRELCVCDLSVIIGASQSSVSHQLAGLKSQQLVKFRKEGKVVYYSLDDEHVADILDQALVHVTHAQ